MNNKARPFIKIAGGKQKLVPLIREMIPHRFGAYHEPFAGGAALFFAMQPKNAFLSDVNKELMNVYTVVRDDVENLIELLGNGNYPSSRTQFSSRRTAYTSRRLHLHKPHLFQRPLSSKQVRSVQRAVW